jgi:ABC-type oligopeptide transport system substrate-binding subunit
MCKKSIIFVAFKLIKNHSKNISMQVVLEVANQRDWLSLMPLLERLGISYNVQPVQTTEDARTKSERDWEIIMGGIKKDNMDEFLRDFEQSRQDRPLPFRD